jgi:hypothetical protein
MDSFGLRRYVDSWAERLDVIRQNRLRSEADFYSFARRCGFVQTYDTPPTTIQRSASPDQIDHDGRPLFHPFRSYALYQGGFARSLERTATVNQIVDVAVLLEPVYWPSITEHYVFHNGIDRATYNAAWEEHRTEVLDIIKPLDAAIWLGYHAEVCEAGHRIDSNRELYLLLRLSAWEKREKLEGRISGALWIRHMAEVIRRGFEEAQGLQWPEEDQAFAGARKRVLGSERPLDEPAKSRRHIARRFGLFSGSAVRWYVEGPTEYYAVLEVLGEPNLYGVELVDLKGRISADKDNIALDLRNWLTEDMNLKRFSIVTFDRDGKGDTPPQRTIRKLSDLITGSVFAHDPDFEFANFMRDELVGIAASLDESDGFSGSPLREAEWNGIMTGKDFEEKYRSVSETHRSLKGERWGRALGRFAEQNPDRLDGKPRPFRDALMHATLAQSSNYDHDRETHRIDPATFQRVPRTTSPGPN